jgi:hypothetical protein
MLPYDGITRTGSKGVSHFYSKTPSDGARYWKAPIMASTATSAYRVNLFSSPRPLAGEGLGERERNSR